MRRSSLPKVVLLLGLFTPSVCFAWGRDGHHIVAEIASHRLTPQAKAAVAALLHGQSMLDVANWADEIRSDRSYRWADPLHYADVPPGQDQFVLDRDCPAAGCVVSAIIRFEGVLRGPDASAAEKTEALKFLIHFVADVHQPLHVGRTTDRGGNDVKVRFFGEPSNLHKVWDFALLEETYATWPELARELDGAITPEQSRRWQGLDPVEWANESYRAAVEHAYVVPPDGWLGEEYFERNIPVVAERLSMAGVRLAAMLNSIFASATTAPTRGVVPRRGK